jgi:hypothetical protein
MHHARIGLLLFELISAVRGTGAAAESQCPSLQ